MSYIDLTDTAKLYDDGIDSVVIQKYEAGIPGGVILDVSQESSTEKVIEAGRVIFNNGSAYAPALISDSKQTAPSGYTTPVGILAHSIKKDSPSAPVMARGQVDLNAMTYEISSIVLTALKSSNYCDITFSLK